MTGSYGAFKLYFRSKRIFREGGFNLRKFVFNSKQLLRRIEVAEQDTSNTSSLEEQKVLRACWNPGEDRFIFDVSAIAECARTSEPTKRNIVGIVGRFYDPLECLPPITMHFKIFFKKLSRCMAGWNEPLLSELVLEWKMLIDDLYGTPLSIIRSY